MKSQIPQNFREEVRNRTNPETLPKIKHIPQSSHFSRSKSPGFDIPPMEFDSPRSPKENWYLLILDILQG